MPRIRTIKPDFWTDERVGALSLGARLLYIASWNLADDEGILIWNAAYLKSQVFPYDKNLPTSHVVRMMAELSDPHHGKPMVSPYMWGGMWYAFIPKFATHQVISRPRPSTHPLPTSIDFVSKFHPNSMNPQGTLIDDSMLEGKGKEGKGKEGKGKEALAAAPQQQNDLAELFTFYQENVGQLVTQVMVDQLSSASKEYSTAWVKDAIVEAVKSGVRNWRYTESILERWKREGKSNGHKRSGEIPRDNQGHPSESKPLTEDELKRQWGIGTPLT